MPDLTTTDQFLAAMAAVSTLEGVAVLGGGFFFYRRVMRAIARIEDPGRPFLLRCDAG